MRNMKPFLTLILSFTFILTAFSQQKPAIPDLPSTEIYLFNIEQKGNTFSLADSSFINVSNNKGYDSQPVFIEQLNSIAYVSERNNKATDVYLYDLKTGISKQFTNNDEAEYSPKLTPDGKYISMVKGAEQNLTRVSLDKKVTEKIYTCKDSIGYYCWLNKDEIAAVVLTNPVSLKLINIKNKTEQYLTDSIGRSLFSYDKGLVLCKTLHSGNWVAYLDLTIEQDRIPNETNKPVMHWNSCVYWIQLPSGTEDFYITDDGWLISSNGSSIVYCNAKDIKKGWQVLADLKGKSISKITRITVNKQKNKLAFVTDEK